MQNFSVTTELPVHWCCCWFFCDFCYFCFSFEWINSVEPFSIHSFCLDHCFIIFHVLHLSSYFVLLSVMYFVAFFVVALVFTCRVLARVSYCWVWYLFVYLCAVC